MRRDRFSTYILHSMVFQFIVLLDDNQSSNDMVSNNTNDNVIYMCGMLCLVYNTLNDDNDDVYRSQEWCILLQLVFFLFIIIHITNLYFHWIGLNWIGRLVLMMIIIHIYCQSYWLPKKKKKIRGFLPLLSFISSFISTIFLLLLLLLSSTSSSFFPLYMYSVWCVVYTLNQRDIITRYMKKIIHSYHQRYDRRYFFFLFLFFSIHFISLQSLSFESNRFLFEFEFVVENFLKD